MGQPDMRTPIAYGLAWPQRISAGVVPLDLTQLSALNFTLPDLNQFPCLSLAFAAARLGGTAPAILNAANEVAVGAFLATELAYLQIAPLVEQVLEQVPTSKALTLAEVLDADQTARRIARQCLARLRSQ
jgi:1-deoxy-D-xylulose-5-phosphate reductoisomerase